MLGRQIVNGEVVVNGIPYSQWGQKEWDMWNQDTIQLMMKVKDVERKLQQLAIMRKWI